MSTEPATKLVDLMAALEASVKAAVDARGAEPTSVSAGKDGAKRRGAAAVREKEAEEAEVEAKPAGRRKTA